MRPGLPLWPSGRNSCPALMPGVAPEAWALPPCSGTPPSTYRPLPTRLSQWTPQSISTLFSSGCRCWLRASAPSHSLMAVRALPADPCACPAYSSVDCTWCASAAHSQPPGIRLRHHGCALLLPASYRLAPVRPVCPWSLPQWRLSSSNFSSRIHDGAAAASDRPPRPVYFPTARPYLPSPPAAVSACIDPLTARRPHSFRH